MLSNYLKVAFRNILKKKYYSFLNLLGLSIGITAAILILIYVQDELSYDNFHPNVEHKSVVALNGKIGNQEVQGVFTPPPMAGATVEEMPGVINATRTNALSNMVIRYEDRAFTEQDVFWADSNFYDFFGYQLLRGDERTALLGPNKAVITESMARKYFGNENAMGKTLIVGNDKTSYEVTGVNADPPHNSHFRFNILLSFSSTDYSQSTQWLNNNLNTYIETAPGVSEAQIQAGFEDLIQKYVGPEIERFAGMSLEKMREMGGKYGFFAIPITDLHLNAPNVQTSFEPPGDITYIYIFSAVGIFLIIIACVNFMNLSTASAAGRAKEVGLRKTLGSNRQSMMVQFLVESIMYVILAMVFSMVLLYLILPWFNQLSGKELTLQIFTEPWFLATLLGMAFGIGFLAGSYPAFYLTAFNPVEVLKGKISRGAKSGGFRRTLVVGQFFISISLIACTLLVNQQLNFMQNKNLGFNKEHSLVLTNTSRLGNNQKAFQEELKSDTRVGAASYSSFTIPGTNNVTVFRLPDRDNEFIMAMYYADYDHKDALGFDMKEGRYFNRDFPTDTSGIVINEAAVKEMSLEDPVGKDIFFPGTQQTYQVLGVMKDFNFESLRNEIMPMALLLTETANEMIIRFDSDDPRESVATVESIWDNYAAGEPADYTFLDSDFDQLFRQEQRLGDVFTAFTIIAIIIACLGLLGLSAYMTEQRKQEIGIRKVLGATTTSIVGLLSSEFLKLTGIAFLLAVPVAWYVIQSWLQNFAYRIDIGFMVFIITAVATAVIVLLTISWQTLKAAYMNPVESIKTE
ncbi:FtsX-like permease family protein [Balneolaceae bacterium YR4-1]|uniref:FtsX-like permease family protein n=1 Tax=Halalkalibaculum roseum TaxID=2709311 RepID=A0A6M1T000_9BACT|nr:ABC transporter permease [Halalkalibaculum roseum]NGP77988.1 FtsX-like permease family protein [Halalkalibaculum roseum]